MFFTWYCTKNCLRKEYKFIYRNQNTYKNSKQNLRTSTHLNCKFGYRLFLKSSNNLDLPCGPLSNELGTVVSVELIFPKSEFVEPNIAVVFKPAATEFLYFASAPGAADNTLEFTKPPS